MAPEREDPSASTASIGPSPDARIEALARNQYGVFAYRQALDCGASRSLVQRRVRARRWMRVAPRVLMLAGWQATYRMRVMIAILQAGPGAVASHRCAAYLRQLDGVRRPPVEITVPRRCRVAPANAIVHTSADLADDEWSIVDGIPTATVTRILVDLAGDGSTSFDLLEQIFESGQRNGETDRARVERAFVRLARPGKHGTARGRELVSRLVDDGGVNHSLLETRFFQLLRDAGLPLPVRQQVVTRPDGRFLHADYAFEGVDGLVELLGFKWHSSSGALTSDLERNNDLALLRRTVLQFTWTHVTRRQAYVIRQVRALLDHSRAEDRHSFAQE